MRRRLVAVASVIICGALAANADAEIETQVQTSARAAVESQAAAVGEAPNEAKAISDQRALMPAVKKAVEAGAAKSLVEHVSNPSVMADVLRLTKPKVVRKSEGLPPVKVKKPANAPARSGQVRAHGADCWNDAWGSLVEWSGVAWLYVRSNAWCGDGYAITWYGWATFAEWTWGSICFTDRGENYSWDAYPSWIHMATWGEAGVSYVWGCLGISGGKATERIAANGYWDFYNDYGF